MTRAIGWQQIRQQVLKRDNYTCQDCFRKARSLDVHHIIPRKKGGTNDLNNLISYCPECHRFRRGTNDSLIESLNLQPNEFRGRVTTLGKGRSIITIPKRYNERIKEFKGDTLVLVIRRALEE